MFFFSPGVHGFEQSLFYLPEFFSVEDPAFSFKRLSKLDHGIFEVVLEPLHDVEVILLKGGLWQDLTKRTLRSIPLASNVKKSLKENLARVWKNA